MKQKRHYPIGAELSKKGVDFRLWAPDHRHVELVLVESSQKLPMNKEENGYFSLFVPDLPKGTHYQYHLDKEKSSYPDPASRFQPLGVEGPSEVVDPAFPWTDDHWTGLLIEDQIIYELHIGTFTPEGTYSAAMQQLEALKDLGITTIELMPLNEFPGEFGWGYDGVNLFAPYHVYGTPNELKAFIDKAHRLGIGVILDVVYNHFGPEGNYIPKFSKDYFNPHEITEWGDAINFENSSSREFFLTNVAYWIEEYHFDGLRVDATPWIFCKTKPHILAEISKTVRQTRPEVKKIIVGESETQDSTLLKPYDEEGYGFDALWNDDFHHTAIVRLTGKREAYYTDYLGSPQEFISALKYGFLYQGQYYDWQKKKRGSFDLHRPPHSKIAFLENHDQSANSGRGRRVHQISDPGNYRALTCLLLLGPNVPLLFQGQEFGSTAPFYYFADHNKELNTLIFKGRKTFLAQFPRLASQEARTLMPNPSKLSTFTKCKLNFKEREINKEQYALHKDLIHLRKEDLVFKKASKIKFDGAVLNADAFIIRFFGEQFGDRLLIINFGNQFIYNPAPEPLLALEKEKDWEMLWSSDSFIYGGEGAAPLMKHYWRISGHSAMVLK